ncbi:MAG: hypothetical protein VKS61_11625 [Candidatus Sericytochromatia bacterium]|nr:hypothetical protein [Candidatus Sericytochromatia bacterium]
MNQGRHPVWPVALALSLGLAGCNVPFAGTSPATAPVQPAATPSATATPAPTPTPVPGVALRGVVLFNDAPVQNATLTAFDVATGNPLPLIAAGGQNLIAAGGQNLIAAGGQNLIAAGGQNLIAAGGQNLTAGTGGRFAVAQASPAAPPTTDTKGAFDLALPPLAPGQVVKLRAVAGDQTYLALFDASGKAIGQDTAPAGYALRQAGGVSLRLKLTIGSTAIANAFEGVIKLQLRLPPAQVASAIAAVFERVQVVAKQVEAVLAASPELGAKLLATVDEKGDVADITDFRETMKTLGLFETVYAVVQQELQTVAKETNIDNKALEAITAENFPLAINVTVTPSGTIIVTDEAGKPTTLFPEGAAGPSGEAPGTPATGGTTTGGGSAEGSSGGGGSGGGTTAPVASPTPTPVPPSRVIITNLPGGLATIAGRVLTLGAAGPVGVARARIEIYRAIVPSTTVASGDTTTLLAPTFTTTTLVGDPPVSVPLPHAVIEAATDGSYRLQGIATGSYWVRAAAREGAPFSNPRYLTFGTSGVGGVDLAVIEP